MCMDVCVYSMLKFSSKFELNEREKIENNTKKNTRGNSNDL